MKIKHSVSSSLYKESIGKDFLQKRFAWGNKRFWANIWGTNDEIMQVGKLMVKRFQRSSQVSFPLIDLDLGY